MAKVITLTCDFSGVASTETNPVTEVKFSFDGKRYTMDMSADSKAKMDKALAPFVAKATELAPVGVSADSENAKIRAWAVTAGHTVNEKGRIPENIVTAYRNANPTT